MKKLRNGNGDLDVLNDVKGIDFLSDEKIAMFIDGDLSSSEREQVISLMAKDEKLRRRISDYVKFKRYEENGEDAVHCQVPSALTERAKILFKKRIQVEKDSSKIFEPVYINYSQNEFEITGIIHQNNQTLLNLELHITKNGQPYKGEVYLYKGELLYRTLKIQDEVISCDLSKKGNYHLYIKDGIIKDNFDLEFEVN